MPISNRRITFATFFLSIPIVLAGPSTDSAKSAPSLFLEEGKGPKVSILPPVSRSNPWFVGAGLGAWFGPEVEFSGLGSFTNLNSLPSSLNPTFGVYDDGFVQQDISGDQTLTSFWAFDNDSQFRDTNGGLIDLSISESLANASDEFNTDPSLGFEFFLGREIGTIGSSKITWGLKAKFSFANFSANSGTSLTSDALQTTDSFELNGVTPPLAPFQGIFTGPGPLISTNSTRSSSIFDNAVSVTGSRSFDVDLYGLSFGPWVSIPLYQDRLHLDAEVGFILAIANGDIGFDSSVSLPSAGTQVNQGRDSGSELLPGVQVSLSARYSLNERWSTYLSASFSALDDLSLQNENVSAEISFDQTYSISAGIIYHF